MPNTKSAAKRTRQIKTRTAANRRVKTGLKTTLKKSVAAIDSKDKASAEASLKSAFAKLDKAAKTGRIHRNKANRQKSRLAKRVAAIA
jgi:small subunit ribosomal protein S20